MFVLLLEQTTGARLENLKRLRAARLEFELGPKTKPKVSSDQKVMKCRNDGG